MTIASRSGAGTYRAWTHLVLACRQVVSKRLQLSLPIAKHVAIGAGPSERTEDLNRGKQALRQQAFAQTASTPIRFAAQVMIDKKPLTLQEREPLVHRAGRPSLFAGA